jgi:hypothetical protein
MKEKVLPISGSPSRLAEAAGQVGLVDVTASVRRVDLGLRDPAAVVAYRMTLPHTAGWLATLDDMSRLEIASQAKEVVARHVVGWRPTVVLLVGRKRGLGRSGPVPQPVSG